MINRKYLIITHPRGGSGYMSKLFQANGFDVQHESMGKDGTSNWQYAVCSDEYPFTTDYKRQDVNFKTVIQVMREPLAAINTIAYVEGRSEDFRAKYVPLVGNPFERAILSYYGWHGLIKAQNPDKILALENAHEKLGFEAVDIYNHTEHESVSENTLRMIVRDEYWWYYERLQFTYKSLL